MKRVVRRKRCLKTNSSANNKHSRVGRVNVSYKNKALKKDKESKVNNKSKARRFIKLANVNNKNLKVNKDIEFIEGKFNLVDKNNKILRRINKKHVQKKRICYMRNYKKTKKVNKYESIKNKTVDDVKRILKSNEFKKASRGLIFAIISLLSIDMIDKGNRKVFLDMEGQELSWSTSNNLDSSNYEYKLFRDNELLMLTKGYKFIESISLDKESPQKINNVKVDKGEAKVIFSWNAPNDMGTKYKYKVLAINKKNNKKYSSRSIKKEIVSGIDKYIINLNGKEYTSATTQFEVDINSLKTGVNNLEIIAVDLAGNESEPKKISFKIDNTKFYLDEYKLSTNNNEITEKTHNIYLVKEKTIEKDGKVVVEQEKKPITIGDNIAEFFISASKPTISNPRYVYENDLVNVIWEESTFGVNNTEFYIECSSKNGLKKYTSNKMKYDNGDFLSGYYYKVTTTPLYSVKQSDSYTMDSRVSLDTTKYDKNKIYYFHVAASDEYGNMSKTKTLELDFKNFTTTGEIKDVVREFLYKNKGVDGNAYRKVTDDVYNAFTYKTIKKIKDMELKISLVSGDIGDFISKHHNVKVTNKNAQYIKEDSTVVYNVDSSIEYLVKEIVKVFNEYPTSPWSSRADFLEVYNAEKDKLKEGKYTEEEYLSEIVWMYISGDEDLEYYAPKSYDFIAKFYNSIMLA